MSLRECPREGCTEQVEESRLRAHLLTHRRPKRATRDLPDNARVEGWDHCQHGVSIGSLCTECGAVVSYDGGMDILGS